MNDDSQAGEQSAQEGLISRKVIDRTEHAITVREVWDLTAKNLPFVWYGQLPKNTHWVRDLWLTPCEYKARFGRSGRKLSKKGQ
jgi:hypothetical protein